MWPSPEPIEEWRRELVAGCAQGPRPDRVLPSDPVLFGSLDCRRPAPPGRIMMLRHPAQDRRGRARTSSRGLQPLPVTLYPCRSRLWSTIWSSTANREKDARLRLGTAACVLLSSDALPRRGCCFFASDRFPMSSTSTFFSFLFVLFLAFFLPFGWFPALRAAPSALPRRPETLPLYSPTTHRPSLSNPSAVQLASAILFFFCECVFTGHYFVFQHFHSIASGGAPPGLAELPVIASG